MSPKFVYIVLEAMYKVSACHIYIRLNHSAPLNLELAYNNKTNELT